METYDLLIVGSGPAGLSAAVYAVRAGLDFAVIEKNPMSGGQVLNTYEVDNYLGMPESGGFDLGMRFREHADRLGVKFINAEVTGAQELEGCRVLHTDRGDYGARALILATGAKHALLHVPGEERLTGRGVSYCAVCDGAFFKGKTAAVVGGGDAALEDAVYLSRFCRKVYLIHRRDTFRGAHILQEEVRAAENVEILYHHTVTEVCGEQKTERLLLWDIVEKKASSLDVDGLFVAVGVKPNTEMFRDLIRCREDGFVEAGEDCATEKEGIFVAGDIRYKPLRQIVTAVADGANAASGAEEYLRI